jgi:hypothetical protein
VRLTDVAWLLGSVVVAGALFWVARWLSQHLSRVAARHAPAAPEIAHLVPPLVYLGWALLLVVILRRPVLLILGSGQRAWFMDSIYAASVLVVLLLLLCWVYLHLRPSAVSLLRLLIDKVVPTVEVHHAALEATTGGARTATPEPETAEPSPLLGLQLRDREYTLHKVLGRGGFATVFGARSQSLGQDVALKLLNPELA